MTKKQLIEIITNFLKEDRGKEIIVKEFNTLRNGRWGMHPYCLVYHDNEVFVRAWSGANLYWRAQLDKLTKTELLNIVAKIN